MGSQGVFLSVRGRVRETLRLLRQVDPRQVARHLLFSLVVGVIGAAASIVLCLCVNAANGLATMWRIPLYLLLPVFGVASIGLYHLCKLPLSLDTASVIRCMRENRPVQASLAPGILFGTCLTVLGGGSVGKEAAALQMGASLGATASRPFKLKGLRRGQKEFDLSGFTAGCGMASCFSALFFAPLGATMFVIELSRFDRHILHRAPALLLGAFVGCALSSAVGIGDIVPKVTVPPLTFDVAAHSALVGVACAFGGSVFAGGQKGIARLNERFIGNPWVAIVMGGLLCTMLVLGFRWQDFAGAGPELLDNAMKGEAEPWYFAVKMLLTMLALGFGFKGGEIMPMFTIGALLGAALGVVGHADASFSAAIGLAAFFSAGSRCPLAAILIGCEVFGWEAAPCLFIACMLAFVGSRDAGVWGTGVKGSVWRRGLRLRKRWQDHKTRTHPGMEAKPPEAQSGASEETGNVAQDEGMTYEEDAAREASPIKEASFRSKIRNSTGAFSAQRVIYGCDVDFRPLNRKILARI